MRIIVEKLLGDASVRIYNKQGELIHTEDFYGKTNSEYVRTIPVSEVEYGNALALNSGEFKFRVVA